MFLHDKGLQKWLSVIIIYLLFFGSLSFLIYKGTPLFIEQLRELTENFPAVLREFEKFSRDLQNHTARWPFRIEDYLNQVVSKIDYMLTNFANHLIEQFMRLFDWLIFIVLIPIIAFYFIKDIDYLQEVFWEFVPEKWRKQLQIFFTNVNAQLGGYIRGQLLLCLIVGFSSVLLFRFIGLKYPLLLGIIIGATNVIPYFGPIIGAIPACLVAITISIKKAIFVIIIIFFIQFLDGNILSPVILGRSLRMHPLLIIFSILIGGELAGVIGLIVAVPIVAIGKTAFQQALLQFRKREGVE